MKEKWVYIVCNTVSHSSYTSKYSENKQVALTVRNLILLYFTGKKRLHTRLCISCIKCVRTIGASFNFCLHEDVGLMQHIFSPCTDAQGQGHINPNTSVSPAAFVPFCKDTRGTQAHPSQSFSLIDTVLHHPQLYSVTNVKSINTFMLQKVPIFAQQ